MLKSHPKTRVYAISRHDKTTQRHRFLLFVIWVIVDTELKMKSGRDEISQKTIIIFPVQEWLVSLYIDTATLRSIP